VDILLRPTGRFSEMKNEDGRGGGRGTKRGRRLEGGTNLRRRKFHIKIPGREESGEERGRDGGQEGELTPRRDADLEKTGKAWEERGKSGWLGGLGSKLSLEVKKGDRMEVREKEESYSGRRKRGGYATP